MRSFSGERIILSLWVGGLWSIGFVAVPLIFASLDDRGLAGQLAGQLFSVSGWLAVAGAVLLALLWLPKHGWRHWRQYLLLITLALLLIMQLYIQPQIISLRDAGLSDSEGFARLHGIASSIYLAVSLLALVQVAFADVLPSDGVTTQSA